MAIGKNLPPQAYTRETLTQAFNWLQTQPEHIKRMAQSPDALIAIYTRSQRYGTGSESDAPVSSQNFISDLKQLAEGLKQFDQPDVAATPAPVRPPAPPSASAGSRSGPTLSHVAQAAPPQVVSATPAPPTASAAPAPRVTPTAAANSGSVQQPPTQLWVDALHPTSQAMVAQIKDQFNLTSDAEAVNMMIAVAYKSLKNLI